MSQESSHNSNPTGHQSTPPSPPEVAEQSGNYETKQGAEQKENYKTKQEEHDEENTKMFKHIQGYLMVVAVLAAGATYQAGLSPPGGFWQANDEQGHIAGTSVLRETFPRRYTAFFYCNSTAFIMSLVIIIMLMHRRFYTHRGMIKALKITMMLDMFGFMGAYAAGSCRELSSSIYLFVMMGGVFIYIMWFAQHYGMMHDCARTIPPLRKCMDCMKHADPVKAEDV
ncbi:uncharacterized protein LOC144560925 [Carex rostrata]